MTTTQALIAAAIASALLGTAFPVARADTDDDQRFLNAMHKHGIDSHSGDADLLTAGHQVCGAMRRGYSVSSLVSAEQIYGDNHLSDDDLKFFVTAAATAFCPELIR